MITLRIAETVFGALDGELPCHIRLRVERTFSDLLADPEVRENAAQHCVNLLHGTNIGTADAPGLVNPAADFQTPDTIPNR